RMDIAIRALRESDLDAADRICRLAFGRFVGLPDPDSFFGDADHVRSRWRADPTAAFVAEAGGEVVGSNLLETWGSFGFFRPLSVGPDLWDRGVAKRLLEPLDDVFARRDVTHAGLFTFATSPKHIGLYQRFGFWPRFLTFVMEKTVTAPARAPSWSRF